MMAYYDALKQQWATLPSTDTTAQKLAAMNALTVAGPNVDVPISSAVGYLGLNAKLATLMKYAANPPATAAGIAGAELVAVMNCPNAPAFGTSNPTTYATLQEMLNLLAGDAASGITSTDVTNLLGLAATTIPWWRANGYPRPVDMGDVQAAGLS